MLEGTVILEWLIGKQVESFIILALLIFNALVGYFQERKTNSALMMLKKNLQIEAKVRRDNQWISIPAKMLVPGDLMRVRSGDFIGADAQIIDGKLNIDQSSLTGESLPVKKRNIKLHNTTGNVGKPVIRPYKNTAGRSLRTGGSDKTPT